jgi:hypothetical protein
MPLVSRSSSTRLHQSKCSRSWNECRRSCCIVTRQDELPNKQDSKISIRIHRHTWACWFGVVTWWPQQKDASARSFPFMHQKRVDLASCNTLALSTNAGIDIHSIPSQTGKRGRQKRIQTNRQTHERTRRVSDMPRMWQNTNSMQEPAKHAQRKEGQKTRARCLLPAARLVLSLPDPNAK